MQGIMNIRPLVLKKGKVDHSKEGVWRHDDIIGKRFGIKVTFVHCVFQALLVNLGADETVLLPRSLYDCCVDKRKEEI